MPKTELKHNLSVLVYFPNAKVTECTTLPSIKGASKLALLFLFLGSFTLVY